MNKIFPLTLVAALLAAALLACLAIDVHALQAPAQLLPGLLLANLIPAVTLERKGAGDSDVDPIEAIKSMLTDQGEAWTRFKSSNDARLDALEQTVTEIAVKAGRPNLLGGSGLGDGEPDRKSLDLAIRALISGDQAKANRHFGEIKAMRVGSNPDGGYLVVPDFSDGMTKVMLEIAPFIGEARTVEIEGDAFEEPIDDGEAGAEWVGETEARGETATPQIAMFSCPVHEIQAEPKITQKLIDTARIDVTEWLRAKVAEKFALAEVSAFFNGDGVKRPRGFLTLPTAATGDATRPRGTLEHVATGASAGFVAPSSTVSPVDVLIDLVSRLKPQFRANAKWMMNRNTQAVVQKLKDSEGRFIWVPSIQAGQPAMLLGYPVLEAEQMPDIAADSLSIVFGDFKKAYTIVRRLGVRFLLDPYTQKPYVKLYAFNRVGGGVNNSQALKLLKFS